MPTVQVDTRMYCPRCDRAFDSGTSKEATLELIKTHVSGQHPDHDPEWYDTYPESFGN